MTHPFLLKQGVVPDALEQGLKCDALLHHSHDGSFRKHREPAKQDSSGKLVATTTWCFLLECPQLVQGLRTEPSGRRAESRSSRRWPSQRNGQSPILDGTMSYPGACTGTKAVRQVNHQLNVRCARLKLGASRTLNKRLRRNWRAGKVSPPLKLWTDRNPMERAVTVGTELSGGARPAGGSGCRRCSCRLQGCHQPPDGRR
jgi:hypothetical protein